ncbi:MAG: DUF4358 domain-containing protein [Lachnospiraceae bacterium]|nr:DUF4358 domain-containing protein [Lachnospiraceae bacterium]
MKNFKKLVAAVMMAALLIVNVGCGGSESAGSSNVALTDIKAKMIEADSSLNDLEYVDAKTDGAKDKFATLVDYDYSKIADYFYGYDKSGKASEVVVVKLKDLADLPDLVSAFKTRAADRKGTFENYDPEQVALVEHYVLTHESDCVAFIISEKNGMAEKAFKECF